MKVKDSVVFITGANRGLGLAFAKAAVAAGARKVYAAARDLKSITLAGVHPIALDVTRPEQAEAAARECGDVTLLINNAGISRGVNLLDTPDAFDLARAEFETNFFGPWAVSRAFAPVLKANGGGAIVNVLSILSWLSLPGAASYSASKSAAWSLSNGLRNALGEQGTQVLSLHVAFMDTDMTSKVPGPKASPDDVVAQTLAALEAGQFEVLADALTRQVKQGLSTDTPPYAAR
ncbi:SDR family oxidoreductase [Variovorax sp. J2P1-59]|uniref:SDR family oxidoreductase n=1 Tax=Variovorax flavidus TaxID=3053501 RepID=UPI002577768B|nr:SDR family oxidoreductase [Variovorax sp. J2P1-59]MDM0074399.1 SDR family oxidoreductase [Variovorax sp. J2P1-59]